jgi:hypothetical protein
MRNDLAGLFWDDTPTPRVVKEVVKRVPPARVWEDPTYLPHLAEAMAFTPNTMTRIDMDQAYAQQHPMLYDVEVYPNFFYVSFTSYTTGRSMCFELSEDTGWGLNRGLLNWVFTSFPIVGFNSLPYDSNIVAMAIAGCSTQDMWEATRAMIVFEERPEDVLANFGVQKPNRNEVDLISVAPLRANLKTYGGRLHAPTMQDLPFVPGTMLSREQRAITRWYNHQGDIVVTAIMYRELREQLLLREKMGARYGLDLRSKSDAQMAEAVIGVEIARRTGQRPKRPNPVPGDMFCFQPEPYLSFATPQLQQVLATVCAAPFMIGADGTVGLPTAIAKLLVPMGAQTYRMGMGGLHSSEQKQVRHSDAGGTLYDRDVASYYPRRILNSGLYPAQLGREFLVVYGDIVEHRLAAKKAGDHITADSEKIVVNGTFGKTGSPCSIIYAPRMMVQVTVGGQLALLMLIERLELAGIEVISANTDGITCYVPPHLHAVYLDIVSQWEAATGLVTEETEYRSVYSRDVNNYMAVKPDGKIKAKGVYLNAYNDPKLAISRFHKNPVNTICLDAVEAYVVRGTPLATTVHACKDVRKFVTVRAVRGGAVKDGVYLGKTVRWYYAKNETGEIIYASSGNKVPRSDGARPAMALPVGIPEDLDLDWYVREADDLLRDFGSPTTLKEGELA